MGKNESRAGYQKYPITATGIVETEQSQNMVHLPGLSSLGRKMLQAAEEGTTNCIVTGTRQRSSACIEAKLVSFWRRVSSSAF